MRDSEVLSSALGTPGNFQRGDELHLSFGIYCLLQLYCARLQHTRSAKKKNPLLMFENDFLCFNAKARSRVDIWMCLAE